MLSMASPAVPQTVEDYHIGIICALDGELAAVEAMLDEEHDPVVKRETQDNNTYSFGRIHRHNVVVACLPAGMDGLVDAATVAKDLIRSFPKLRFGLLVGIGGGIPNHEEDNDVRLGDVVVSRPTGTTGGVIRYDKGKMQAENHFEIKGIVNPPPKLLLTAIQSIQARHRREDSKISQFLTDMFERYPKMKKKGYAFPGRGRDVLYKSNLNHPPGNATCSGCDTSYAIEREERDSHDPEIHYGIIASGDRVIKNPVARDAIRDRFGALCVEMEAAGLMKEFPCLVIRGICDYADSHKNDTWQCYAAAVAAGYAKELLLYVSAEDTRQATPVGELKELNGTIARNFAKVHVYHDQQIAHIRRQELHYQDDQDRQCHQVFKTSNYEQSKNINVIREPGTCIWVLEHEGYRQWLSSKHNDVLWISADPGCGKSVLSRSLIDQDIQASNEIKKISICYFFFKDNENQNSLSLALCAILHQLFRQQPRLVKHAMETWLCDREMVQQETDALWRILLAAAHDSDASPILCVLDALDECRTKDRNQLIRLLREFYGLSLQMRRGFAKLKFLITSRPYGEIEDASVRSAGSPPLIRLRGEDQSDQISTEIDIVVRSRVRHLADELGLQDNIALSLEARLLSMEHRTYLWLHLAIDDIRTKFRDSLRPQQEFIDTLPASVDAAYEQMLGRVAANMKDVVKKILLIIIGSSRSLTLNEMAYALDIATSTERPKSFSDFTINVQHLKRNIRQWCGLFVFLNHSRLYLIHQTAKEFLLPEFEMQKSVAGGWRHCFRIADVHLEMARIGMQYLCLKEFEGDWPDLDHIVTKDHNTSDCLRVKEDFRRDLFVLASESWARHWRHIENDQTTYLRYELEILYDIDTIRCYRWLQAAWHYNENEELLEAPTKNLLHLSVFNGHYKKLQEVLETTVPDVELLRFNSWSLLMLAAQQEYPDIVQLLIEHGANPRFTRDDLYMSRDPCNALEVACRLGHTNVAQRIIAAGADVNYESNNFCGSPLRLASFYGHESVVQLLLDHGADVDAHDKRTKNFACALFKAVEEGHAGVVRLLLEHGASITCCEDNDNILCVALRGKNRKQMLKLLIEHGADINPKRGKSPLYVASFNKDEVAATLLIEEGASAKAQSNGLWNALEIAALSGTKALVRLLLDHGADTGASCGRTGSILHAASCQDNTKIVELLLDKGAVLNLSVKGYGTPLSQASLNNHTDVVELLVRYGADVKSGDALHLAASRGHWGIARLLLEKGTPVDLIANSHNTALIQEPHSEHEPVVRTLLVQATGGHAENALYIASALSPAEFQKTLPEHRNVVAELVSGPRTSLTEACYSGHENIVRLLVEHGANPNLEDALHIAASQGHVQILEHLVAHGGDVNMTGSPGTPLTRAAFKGHVEVVEFLLSQGADPDSQDDHGWSPLQLACHYGHDQVAKLLIDHDANMDIYSRSVETPLLLALARNDIKFAQLLIDRGANVNFNPPDAPHVVPAIQMVKAYISDIRAHAATDNDVRSSHEVWQLQRSGATLRMLRSCGASDDDDDDDDDDDYGWMRSQLITGDARRDHVSEGVKHVAFDIGSEEVTETGREEGLDSHGDGCSGGGGE